MIAPVAPGTEPSERALENDAKKAATQLEAHFLTYMLSQMRGESGMMGKGVGAATYQGMIETHLGDALAESSPLGLRDVITQAMLGAESAPKETSHGLHITSAYGVRQHPLSGETAFHHGYDLRAAEGDAVFAPRTGTVVFSGERGGYGQMVELLHEDGTTTRYAHLSARAVSVGARITAGQTLGSVGQTGTSTGPHLHFEVRRGGESIEPGEFLKKSNTQVLAAAPTGVRPRRL